MSESYPLVSMIRVNQARDRFFNGSTVPEGLIPDPILRSWHRSRENGVPSGKENPNPLILPSPKLRELEEAHSPLLRHSQPVMENLYAQIRQTSSMVILTNASGVILHSIGDADFVGRARRVSLLPGGVWSEELRGTNAIGTAIVEGAPVVVHRSEHFSVANHFLTCAASPIFDPFGSILGVLDVSGDGRAYQQHTMALVRISTQQIENQMFASGFDDHLVLHFHTRPECIGTLYEGIAVFDRDGAFIAANRTALLHLGLDRYQMRGKNLVDLFAVPQGTLEAHAAMLPQPVLQLRTARGVPLSARVRPTSATPAGTTPNRKDRLFLLPPAARGTDRSPCLGDLERGDPAMRRIIAKAEKVLGHDITILLEGESGTGKELFSRAIHNSGPRQEGTFVALNCAAIPEGLIEAELFGYREGAFTGARRKGQPGKIRQADGGTLFLDEIGDMPLNLQARLLRVLQERSVCPLGGTESHEVDIAVICATNRRIRAEVAAGRFREDLYYRLNGLLLTLPPLKERSDRLSLARAIVAELAGPGRTVRLHKEVVELFARHPWPGNIRQLQNVLRTAVALLDGDEITTEQLPEDFLDQYREQRGGLESLGPFGEGARGALHKERSRLEDLEELAIRQALDECRGNLSATAKRLGISRSTLYRKLQKRQLH